MITRPQSSSEKFVRNNAGADESQTAEDERPPGTSDLHQFDRGLAFVTSDTPDAGCRSFCPKKSVPKLRFLGASSRVVSG